LKDLASGGGTADPLLVVQDVVMPGHSDWSVLVSGFGGPPKGGGSSLREGKGDSSADFDVGEDVSPAALFEGSLVICEEFGPIFSDGETVAVAGVDDLSGVVRHTSSSLERSSARPAGESFRIFSAVTVQTKWLSGIGDKTT
jgi:hypothetical protein